MCNINEKTVVFPVWSRARKNTPETPVSGVAGHQLEIFRYSEGVSFLYLRKIWEK